MAINVNTNVSAMTAQRYLNGAADGMQKSMERLSSGYKINSARDDAAGLQISNRLTSQSRGLDMAVKKRQRWYFHRPNCRRGDERNDQHLTTDARSCVAIL